MLIIVAPRHKIMHYFITSIIFCNFCLPGTEIMPKSVPTRIVATFWWLFCLICVSSYTANLAAFLTKSKMKLTINNADDLAGQTEIAYGCFPGGSTRGFFKVNKSFFLLLLSFCHTNITFYQFHIFCSQLCCPYSCGYRTCQVSSILGARI